MPPSNGWGGRFTLRYEAEGMHPEVVVWMELPSRKVVGFEIRKPVEMEEGWFAQALRRAMKKPLAGKPRRPARVRVADAALAAELREEHDDIEIAIAPTPELDELVESMAADAGALHFAEDSRLPPSLVGELFRAAERFYRLAPWTFVHDAIRVDIPSLEIEGNCVRMIIGRKEKTRGFLLFPSIEGLDAFMRSGADLAPGEEPELIGTHVLSLTFDKKADVPPPALRAVEEHEWPVADDGAYPNAELHDEICAPMRLDEQDVRMLVACTNALVAFCAMHRDVLASDEESISESFTGDDDLTVRLTYPFDDTDLYEDEPPWENAPVRKLPTPGRNDPCHCGSGKKYKKCHLDADQKAASGSEGVHAVDRRLLSEMLDIAAARFGPKWLPKELKRLPPDEALMLVLQWAAYELPADGRPLVEHFLASAKLTAEESAWIAAQRRAWLLKGETVIAQLFVTDGTLRVETNSEQRATAVRRTIEKACGGLIRHRSREQKDPLDVEPPSDAPPPEPAEEEQQLLREFKQQHYRDWLDDPLPALGGKTPRQAARSRAGRKDLDLLLRHIEHDEAAQPEGSRFDVSTLRSELGL